MVVIRTRPAARLHACSSSVRRPHGTGTSDHRGMKATEACRADSASRMKRMLKCIDDMGNEMCDSSNWRPRSQRSETNENEQGS